MNCVQVRHLLPEYAEGGLDHSQRAAVEAHLAACQRCTAESAALRAYFETLRGLPRVGAPADFLERVHARLAAPSPVRRFTSRMLRPLAVKIPLELAGLAATVVLVLWIHQALTTAPAPVREPAALEKKVTVPEEPVAPAGLPPQAPATLQEVGGDGHTPPVLKTVQLVLATAPAPPSAAEPRAAPEAAAGPGRSSEDGAPATRRDPSPRLRSQTQPERGVAFPARPGREKEQAVPERAAAHPAEQAVLCLQEHIGELQGAIVEVTRHRATGIPASLLVELPAAGYEQLLAELKHLGEVRTAGDTGPVSSRPGSVRVKIVLVPADP